MKTDAQIFAEKCVAERAVRRVADVRPITGVREGLTGPCVLGPAD